MTAKYVNIDLVKGTILKISAKIKIWTVCERKLIFHK